MKQALGGNWMGQNLDPPFPATRMLPVKALTPGCVLPILLTYFLSHL